MALAKNIILKNNFGEDSVFGNAYIKVTKIYGGKENILATVGIFKEKDGELLIEKHHNVAVSLDGKNFIAQAYDHIKTLPEFSKSIDC
jgi:hypothetical protein